MEKHRVRVKVSYEITREWEGETADDATMSAASEVEAHIVPEDAEEITVDAFYWPRKLDTDAC